MMPLTPLRVAAFAFAPFSRSIAITGVSPALAARNGVNGIMMAANVAAREEDMTGRNKTQKDAIDTIALLLKAGTDINGVDNQGRTAAQRHCGDRLT